MVGVFSFKRFTKNHLMNLHKYLMCGGKKKHRFLWKKTSEIDRKILNFGMVHVHHKSWLNLQKYSEKSIIVHP